MAAAQTPPPATIETAPGIIFGHADRPGLITPEYWLSLRKHKEILKLSSLSVEDTAKTLAEPAKEHKLLEVSAQLIGKTVVCNLASGASYKGKLSHLLDPATGRSVIPGNNLLSVSSFAVVLSDVVPPPDERPIFADYQISHLALAGQIQVPAATAA